MSYEGVMRCRGCGRWIMIKTLSCSICEIHDNHEKGISHAETNQRGATVLGARETEKGEG